MESQSQRRKKKKKSRLPENTFGFGAKASKDGEIYFLKEMNCLGRGLGMFGTRWSNPHGLNDPGNVSNVDDMIKLCVEVWKNGLLREIMKTKYWTASVCRLGDNC